MRTEANIRLPKRTESIAYWLGFLEGLGWDTSVESIAKAIEEALAEQALKTLHIQGEAEA